MASALGIVNTRAYIEQLRRNHADSGTYLCLVNKRNMYASPAPFHWPDTAAAKVSRHSLASHPIIFDQPSPRGWLCLGSSSEQTYSYKYMRITLPQKDSVWAKAPPLRCRPRMYAAVRGTRYLLQKPFQRDKAVVTGWRGVHPQLPTANEVAVLVRLLVLTALTVALIGASLLEHASNDGPHRQSSIISAPGSSRWPPLPRRLAYVYALLPRFLLLSRQNVREGVGHLLGSFLCSTRCFAYY